MLGVVVPKQCLKVLVLLSSKAGHSISHSPGLIREAISTMDIRVRSPRLEPSTVPLAAGLQSSFFPPVFLSCEYRVNNDSPLWKQWGWESQQHPAHGIVGVSGWTVH